MKYVKYGEVGWTPVMRRSARSEESERSGNLNVNNGRSLMYKNI